jgi:hypothetical protein
MEMKLLVKKDEYGEPRENCGGNKDGENVPFARSSSSSNRRCVVETNLLHNYFYGTFVFLHRAASNCPESLAA